MLLQDLLSTVLCRTAHFVHLVSHMPAIYFACAGNLPEVRHLICTGFTYVGVLHVVVVKSGS